MALATLVSAIDFTAFSVALPSMERDLHAQLATVQWVGLASGIQHAFLVDAAAGLLGTAVTVTRAGTRPAPDHERAERRLRHHRLVHNRDA